MKDRSPIRVAIVDDRAIIRSALQLLVNRYRRFAVVTTSSKDPVRLATAVREQPDVVLLNLGRDDQRDVDCLLWLAKTAPGVRVLLLTDGADGQLNENAIRLGAHGLVLKDQSPDVLRKALESVQAGEYWIDHATAAAFVTEACRKQRANGRDTSTLTARECEVVALVVKGLRNKEIAARLSISETTVRHHLTSIFAKLEVSDRLALVVHAFRNRLVAAPSGLAR